MKFVFTCAMLCSAWPLFAQFVIFSNLKQETTDTSSFELTYTTNSSGQAVVRYGQTINLELGLGSAQSTAATTHRVRVSGLQAANFYYAQIGLVQGSDTAWANRAYYSTAAASSGNIKIYFTKNIYTPISSGSYPDIYNSGTNILTQLVRCIDSAQTSIEAAVYNNDQSSIVSALRRAQQRGVQVRYVADGSTANSALSGTLPFDVVYLQNSSYIMHNKFLVVDADNPQKALVWTGSMNWTDNNINDDPNNVLVIQDQALARAYRMEFEEMWGSASAQPGSSPRFGSNKSDNTPHDFFIGGYRIESSFSPSDRTTSRILTTLNSADNDLSFALLTLTRSDLGNSILSAHQRGLQVRGLIENTGDISSQYPSLSSAGVDVSADNQSGQLHHKYGIVDAGALTSDPCVITGSHNWTTAAETGNDENTLILHHPVIANLYMQEFARRYCDVHGGTCQFTLQTGLNQSLNEVENIKIWPNPSRNHQLNVSFNILKDSELQFKVYNAQGLEVQTLNLGTQAAGTQQRNLEFPNLPAGTYYLTILKNDGFEVQPFVLLD